MAPSSDDPAAMKAPDAFRTISEVAEELDLPQHVLRFWETRFNQIKPMKRGGGRRYYRPEDVELLRGIRALLYAEGFTIRGVQRLLKEKGIAFVAGVGRTGSVQADAVAAREEGGDPADWRLEESAEGDGALEADAATQPELRQTVDLRTDPGFAPVPEADDVSEPKESTRPAPVSTPKTPRAARAGGGLNPGDRRRIEFALADLLEAKRLLDQAR